MCQKQYFIHSFLSFVQSEFTFFHISDILRNCKQLTRSTADRADFERDLEIRGGDGM